MSVWRLECCHSLLLFPLLFISLHPLLSLRLTSFRGAIECLRLVYEEPWFNQWGLACLCGEGGKYEWFLLLHSKPPLWPFILKISHHRPSSAHNPLLHPVTLFHWYVHVSVGVYLCKADSGQRLIFVAGSVCIPTACRRLGGQLLCVHSLTQGPLQKVFASSHCLVISRVSWTKTNAYFQAFVKNDRLCLWNQLG